eukprot:jgi/Tetstr1/429368/TSEL_019283.t1
MGMLFKLDIQSLLHGHRKRHKVKFLASCTGKLISMGLALGPVSRLFSRGLYANIAQAERRGHHVALSEESREELRFWAQVSRQQFTGRIVPDLDNKLSVFLECDASGIGWGGLARPTDGSSDPIAKAHGFFLPDLRVLRWEDVSFLPTYLEFRFVKRKNAQHRLCGKVRVAKMHGAVVCVYGLLRRRSGGASAAANADIPFATWGQHGGWKSTSAQLRYMGLDEEHVLSVSRAILSLAEEDELDDSDGDGSPSDTDSDPSRDAT